MNKLNNTQGWKGGQYLKMLNDQKNKQLQTATLEYYTITRDEDKYVLVAQGFI